MEITRKSNKLTIRTRNGYEFTIRETEEGRLKVEVPGERIMYGTEEGNNNANFILLIK